LRSVRASVLPIRISNFEQVTATGAPEILSGRIADMSAGNAAEKKVSFAHARLGSRE